MHDEQATALATTLTQWLGRALFFLVPALVVGGVGVGIFAAQTYNEGATVFLKGCVGQTVDDNILSWPRICSWPSPHRPSSDEDSAVLFTIEQAPNP